MLCLCGVCVVVVVVMLPVMLDLRCTQGVVSLVQYIVLEGSEHCPGCGMLACCLQWVAVPMPTGGSWALDVFPHPSAPKKDGWLLRPMVPAEPPRPQDHREGGLRFH